MNVNRIGRWDCVATAVAEQRGGEHGQQATSSLGGGCPGPKEKNLRRVWRLRFFPWRREGRLARATIGTRGKAVLTDAANFASQNETCGTVRSYRSHDVALDGGRDQLSTGGARRAGKGKAAARYPRRKAGVALVKQQRTEAMFQRARELAAQGPHPQTIELLLVMEGFAEAGELISQDFAKELKQTAAKARKEQDAGRS
jgi:hypothetical protein